MAHLAHYKEAHPTVFVVTHWINLVCMILLIITGFQIHFPYWGDVMGLCRGLHVFCGIVLFFNCIVRMILAFFVKSAPTLGTRQMVKDYKVWLPQADNKHQALPWIRYYFFLKKDHPLSAKYGVPQKIAYLCIPVLILLMAWTGLCLWGPTMDWGICQFLLGAWGGAMSVRIIHYFGMFVFICFMLIHIYLCCMEGTPTLKLMFARKETAGQEYDPEKHNVVQ